MTNTSCAYGIAAATYYLPQERRHVRDWGRELGGSATQLAAEMEANGLGYFHVSSQNALELAEQAVARLFAGCSLGAGEVDLVLYCHSTESSVMAAPASMPASLISRFGMTKASGYSIAQQKCTSVVHALGLVRTILWRHPEINNIVIVSADLAASEQLRNLGNYAMSSDGALAMWVRRGEMRNRICAAASRSDPSFYLGMAKTPAQLQRFTINYALTASAILKQLMSVAEWTSMQVDAMLAMNLNERALKQIANLVALPEDRLFTENIHRIGHVFCCDPFINFIERFKGLAGHDDTKALIYASGSSGCFAGLAISNVSSLGAPATAPLPLAL